jgi:hypothetical protein
MKISTEGITVSEPLNAIVQITEDKTIITDGPLSLQFTNALNEIYKKEVDLETGLVLESQANDQILTASNWIANHSAKEFLSNSGQEVGLLYGVQETQASISDVVSISETVGDMNQSEKDNSAFILVTKVDNTNDGEVPQVTTMVVNPFARAIEEIAKQNNIKVFTSLESYLTALKG